MFFKRWIVVAVVNALLLGVAFQLFGRNTQFGQAQAGITKKLYVTTDKIIFLPLVMEDYRYDSTPTPTPTMTNTGTLTITDTPTMTNTGTLTITDTPTITNTGTITTTPTETYTPTLTPTFSGTPPAICEWHYLPNKTETFSYDLGPVTHKFSIANTMTVSVVRVSANLFATNCSIAQQVSIKGNLVGEWFYLGGDYKIYTETQYASFNVHVGDPIVYTAYAVNFNCSGAIKGASNYVEVCGNP